MPIPAELLVPRKRIRTDRLAKLIDHLEAEVAPHPDRFDLGAWAYKTDCGTVACAVGHACSVPEFATDGLHLEWHGRAFANGRPALGSLRGIEAVMGFFGLTWDQAEYLFTPEGFWESDDFAGEDGDEVPLADVIGRLREFVRAHTTEG